uniref:Cytochrome P450 n=1 Tax=Fagus sylvatica TaxID=28930 RepID=A0A2N9I1S4_FAGSY
MNMVREVLKQRLASPPEKRQGDFLDHVIQDMNSQDFLTEDFVVQLFFGLLYVSFDTISTMTTLTFKLLDENPDVLQELIVEHEAILKKREKPGSSITWNEYKSMSFTLQVINEVLRLGNMTPGLFRRTLADVQVNGYTIPAGWPIMIATSALHLNSEIFNDPLAFNPWRWKDRKSNEMSKNFMPFGEGMKQCAGAEYTRVFLAIFIHVLVTKYRWMKIMGGDICRNPFIGFGKGLHIKSKIMELTDQIVSIQAMECTKANVATEAKLQGELNECLRSDWLNVANSDDIVNLVINPPIQSQGMSSADEKIQVQTSIQITLTLETIWNYHNRVVHSDTKPNLITIIKSIERRILEHVDVATPKVHVINKVTDCLEKPLHDTVKLNTDAALLGNEAILAIVARDDSGVIIMAATKKMFTEDPAVAEDVNHVMGFTTCRVSSFPTLYH